METAGARLMAARQAARITKFVAVTVGTLSPEAAAKVIAA